MARHSFSATIINLSNQKLTLQSKSCDHGEITNGPDSIINPLSASFCRTESTFFTRGDHASLKYLTNAGQQLEIYWYDNGFGSIEIAGHPEYSVGQTPPSTQTLSVAHTTNVADGAQVSAIFVIYPTPTVAQLPLLLPNSQPITTNPLGSCDLVLAVSEQALNDQLKDLSFMGVISRSWAYQDDEFGQFTATTNPPTVTITSSSVSNSQLQLSISFQSGNLILKTGPQGQTQSYSMSGWNLVFSVAYSIISFSSSQISELVHPQLVPIVQKNLSQIASGSGIPDSEFTIQQLFLDMMNADVASYDKQASNIPLSTTKEQNIFSVLIGGYINSFPNNAYVLGYPLTAAPQAATPIPQIYPSDLKLYPLFDPNGSSLNYLMMTNGRQFTDQGVSIPHSLLNNNQISLAVAYDLFNQQYLQNLVEQVNQQLNKQFSLSLPITPITSTEQGNYSWIGFKQDSGDATTFGDSGGSYQDYNAAYGQGFNLNLIQFTDSEHQMNYLALNLEIPNVKALQEGHAQQTYANGSSAAWSAVTTPTKLAVLIEPGSQGTMQVIVTKLENCQNSQLYNDMDSSTETLVSQWIQDADGNYAKGFNNLENINLTFDDTFTNTIILPLDSLLIYKGVSFLNQVNPTPEQLRASINYPSALTGTLGIPTGSSANNAVIFGASYTATSQAAFSKQIKE